MTKRGFILTSFQAWDDANRSEDVLEHGPDMDLDARDLSSREVNDLFLQSPSDDSVGSEDGEDNGYSDAANMVVDEFLARAKRSDTEARLARRLEEKLAPDIALGFAGLSCKARDLAIKSLEDRLDGVPDALARQRADLRRKAAELAPHNLTEMIGEPSGRGRS